METFDAHLARIDCGNFLLLPAFKVLAFSRSILNILPAKLALLRLSKNLLIDPRYGVEIHYNLYVIVDHLIRDIHDLFLSIVV